MKHVLIISNIPAPYRSGQFACLRSRNGFINTGGGVVICQSKGRKSLFYGMFNQFGRGIAAIGFGGMYM